MNSYSEIPQCIAEVAALGSPKEQPSSTLRRLGDQHEFPTSTEANARVG